MEAVKFYSVTENGQELQMLKSLLEAAALWEISTTRRNVYEVTPNHESENRITSWTRVAEIPGEELATLMRKSRERPRE
jgi:hypothetical protein